MTVYPQVALWILVVTAVTLFWVALTDLREFRIPNELVLALIGLYILYALVSGHWVTMRWNIGFALLMLAGMIYTYWQQQMGGGDLKLLVAAFLWAGPWNALIFAILLLVFVGIHYAAVRLGWATAQRSGARLRIPLAPAVAAALIGTFALGSRRRHRRPAQRLLLQDAQATAGVSAPRRATVTSPYLGRSTGH